MSKVIIVTSFLILAQSQILAQKVIKTISKEVCDCFNKEGKNAKKEEKKQILGNCMGQSFAKNSDGLKKEMKLDLQSENVDINKLAEQVGMELAVTCPEFTAYAMEAYGAKNGETDVLDASGFKVDKAKAKTIRSGKYKYVKMYVNEKSIPIKDSTSYFEFKDNATKYYDYSENDTKAYVYKVVWKSETVAELTLLEKKNITDDPVTKIGDKVIFTVKNTENSLVVEHRIDRINLAVVSVVAK